MGVGRKFGFLLEEIASLLLTTPPRVLADRSSFFRSGTQSVRDAAPSTTPQCHYFLAAGAKLGTWAASRRDSTTSGTDCNAT